MKISQQLKIKQNQSLIMTPQLQQAIKLLQLSNLELSEFVENARAENPFIKDETSSRSSKIRKKYSVLRLVYTISFSFASRLRDIFFP